MIRRFFARFMDLCFFSQLSFIIYVIFRPRFFSIIDLRILLFKLDYYISCSHLYFSVLLDYSLGCIVLLFMTAIFLALISSVFGTTPGKAALGIKVLPEAGLHGAWMRFGFYLWREVRVWIFGLGCGFLLISPIFMIWQAVRLQKGKAAFYDGIGKVRVIFVKVKILVLVVWLSVALSMLAFIGTVLVFSVKTHKLLQEYECIDRNSRHL